MTEVQVKNVTGSDIHWVVLEGSIEGVPQVTTRRSIHAGALAEGRVTISDEVAALKAQVAVAYTHWLAAQEALKAL